MKNLFSLAFIANSLLCEEFNPEGVAAGVDGFSKPNKEIMDEVLKEETEREKEEKKNAAKIQLQVDRFDQEFEVIRNRKAKAYYNADNEATKKRTEENKAYLAGGIDTEEHKKNLDKIAEECSKKKDEAAREYRKACDNLRTKNPEGYRRSNYRYDL